MIFGLGFVSSFSNSLPDHQGNFDLSTTFFWVTDRFDVESSAFDVRSVPAITASPIATRFRTSLFVALMPDDVALRIDGLNRGECQVTCLTWWNSLALVRLHKTSFAELSRRLLHRLRQTS